MTMEGETTGTEETGTNGATPPAAAEEPVREKTDSVKPWIAAGFKSRDEWRKSKGQKSAKSTATKPAAPKKAASAKKAAAPKKVKKSAKSKAKPVKAKTKKVAKAAIKKVAKKAKVQAKSAKTAKEKREAHERTLRFLKATGKREEPNAKEAKVLASFGGKGKTRTIAELAEKAFPSRPKAQARSWVRNCLRWIAASKHAKRTGDGEYTRIA